MAETAKYKATLVHERQAVLTAAARRDGSATRADELFAMIRQQRANVAALAEVAAKHGGLAPDAAAAFVKQMTADGRLVQELWS